jgi:hypothetical protein
MAWPSGTKAGTSNVDAGTDKIRLARPDIKQNIDNVNEIIDHYSDTGGPYSSVGTYTKQQAFGITTLSTLDNSVSNPAIAWDLNTAQCAEFTNASSTKAYNFNLTNPIAGGTYILVIHNNTTAVDCTFSLNQTGATFLFPGGTSFYGEVTANSRIIVTLLYQGPHYLVTFALDCK